MTLAEYGGNKLTDAKCCMRDGDVMGIWESRVLNTVSQSALSSNKNSGTVDVDVTTTCKADDKAGHRLPGTLTPL